MWNIVIGSQIGMLMFWLKEPVYKYSCILIVGNIFPFLFQKRKTRVLQKSVLNKNPYLAKKRDW